MSNVLSASTALGENATHSFFRSDQFVAVSLAVLFHVTVIALLLASKQESEPVSEKVNSIKVQMLMQAAPMPVPLAKPTIVEVVPEPVVVEVTKPIKKELANDAIKEAKLAKKRVDKLPLLLAETNPEPLEEVKTTPREEAPATVAATSTPLKSQDKAAQDALDKASLAAANFDTSQYLPVQKDAPAYPARALNKGVQGACTVRYTVNTEGRVENSEALSDCHPFFIKPSLEATKSFQYTPRVVNGKAVKVLNVKNSFQYRIE